MKAILSLIDYYVSLLSLIKVILSLIHYYLSLVSSFSLINAIFHRVSKWGSLSFPMTVYSMQYIVCCIQCVVHRRSQGYSYKIVLWHYAA